jgi:hypothetical protein
LHNLALFWVKNANFFADCFGENIFKIITSVPERLKTVQKSTLYVALKRCPSYWPCLNLLCMYVLCSIFGKKLLKNVLWYWKQIMTKKSFQILYITCQEYGVKVVWTVVSKEDLCMCMCVLKENILLTFPSINSCSCFVKLLRGISCT